MIPLLSANPGGNGARKAVNDTQCNWGYCRVKLCGRTFYLVSGNFLGPVRLFLSLCQARGCSRDVAFQLFIGRVWSKNRQICAGQKVGWASNSPSLQKKGCAGENYKSGRPYSGIQKDEILRAFGVFLSWGIKGTCFINTVLIYALVTKTCISHERNVQKMEKKCVILTSSSRVAPIVHVFRYICRIKRCCRDLLTAFIRKHSCTSLACQLSASKLPFRKPLSNCHWHLSSKSNRFTLLWPFPYIKTIYMCSHNSVCSSTWFVSEECRINIEFIWYPYK